jgi:hypothetical protein
LLRPSQVGLTSSWNFCCSSPFAIADRTGSAIFCISAAMYARSPPAAATLAAGSLVAAWICALAPSRPPAVEPATTARMKLRRSI